MALTTFFPRWRIDDPDEIDAFFETSMPGPQTQRSLDAAAAAQDRLRARLLGTAARGQASGAASTPWISSGRTAHFIGRYRKMHVPGSSEPEAGTTTHLERRYFEPGDLGFPVFDYRGVQRRHGDLQ